VEKQPHALWLAEPEVHDFPAAAAYLDLLFSQLQVARTVADLHRATTSVRKVKDVMRASGLPLLPVDNRHVAHNINKVKKGELLSPVLLVRHNPLIIADGYHRICAAYHLTEDMDVPCRIASI
jgi:hypothetical protein